ncbi:MAG: hypothetical protein QOH35_1863 [Acidobacteriaceae bacterium]|jgi:hypothetical protein|nr:hypothetical protein [Acidobacteriaceae bacterium]
MNVDTGQLATWQIAIYWTERPWQEPPRDGSSLDGDLLRYARIMRGADTMRPATERYDITATVRLQSADGTSGC